MYMIVDVDDDNDVAASVVDVFFIVVMCFC